MADSDIDAAVLEQLNAPSAPPPPATPERSAKSVDVGEQLGVPPSVVETDPEAFAKQLKDQTYRQTIQTSPYVRGYFQSYPDESKASTDDMVALDMLSKTAETATDLTKKVSDKPNDIAPGFADWLRHPAAKKPFISMGMAVTPEQAKKAGEDFVKSPPPLQEFADAVAAGWGDYPFESAAWFQQPTWQTSARDFFDSIGMNWGVGKVMSDTAIMAGTAGQGIVGVGSSALEIMTRGFNAALYGGAELVARQAASPEDRARAMQDLIVAGQMAQVAAGMEPTGSLPPKVSPVLPSVKAAVREAGLNALVKAADETKTKARSPAAMNAFTRFTLGDQTISILPDPVLKLYESKGEVPKEGDPLLGFVPGIDKKLEFAAQTGTALDINLADYLTHVKPETHAALSSDIMVDRQPSFNRAKEFESEIAKAADREIANRKKLAAAGAKGEKPTWALYDEEGNLVDTATGEEFPAKTLEGGTWERIEPAAAGAKEPLKGAQETGTAGLPGKEAIPATETTVPEGATAPAPPPELAAAPTTDPLEQSRRGEFTYGTATRRAKAAARAVSPENILGKKLGREYSQLQEEFQVADQLGFAEEKKVIGARISAIEKSMTRDQLMEIRGTGKQSKSAELWNTVAETLKPLRTSRNARLDALTNFLSQLDPVVEKTDRITLATINEILRQEGKRGDPALLLQQATDANAARRVAAGMSKADAQEVAQGIQRQLQQTLSRPPAVYTKGPKKGQVMPPEVAARQSLFLDPLFQDAKSAGMSEDLFAAYSRNLQDWAETVKRNKAEAAARAEAKRVREATKEEKENAQKEFDARRDVQSERAMRDLKIKISSDEVDPMTLPRGLVGKDGMTAEDVAAAIGHDSGEQLVSDLEALHAERDGRPAAEHRTDTINKMIEGKVPPPEIYDLELYSEPISKMLHDDLRVMQRQGGGTPLTLEELQQWAREQVQGMKLQEATDARKWNQALHDNGKAAEKALLAGDVVGAFKSKNDQLKTHLIAREVKAFQEQAMKRLSAYVKDERPLTEQAKALSKATEEKEPKVELEYHTDTVIAKRYQKKKFAENVDPVYSAHIKDLMARAGIPVASDSRVVKDAAVRGPGKGNLADFILEKKRQGVEISVSADLQNPAWGLDHSVTTPIKEMTVQQYRDFFDSLRSLDHAGREEQLVRVGNKVQALNDYVREVVDSVTQLPNRQRDIPMFNREYSTTQGVKHKLYQLDSILTAPEYIIDDLDLRDPFGPLNRGLWKPMQEASHFSDQLFEESSKFFMKQKIIKNAKRKVETPFRNRMTTDAEGGRPEGDLFRLKREDLIPIAAALGNKTARDNIIWTLMGPAAREDLAAATKVVEDFIETHLTPDDWDIVQGLWDYFDSMQRDHIDPMHRRLTGVMSDPIQFTPWNGHAGGNFPVIRDPGMPVASDSVVFNYAYRGAATAKAYERAAETNVPTAITNAGSRLPSIVKQMLHDISHREVIQNGKKILSNPDIRTAIIKHYGHEYATQLDYWLKDVANSYTEDSQKVQALEQFSRGVRKVIAVQALGLNMRVLFSPNIVPVLKYLVTDSFRLNKRNFWYNFFTSGILNWMTFGKDSALNSTWRFAMENSPDLRNRILNQHRDLREAFERMQGQRGAWTSVQRNAVYYSMFLAAKVDQFLGYMTWMQEYNNTFLKGKSYFGPAEKLYSHDQAVYAANKLFRKWYGAYATVNLPAVMRMNETAKLATTLFYSYSSAMYQVQRDAIRLGVQSVGRTRKGLPMGRSAAFTKAMALGLISFVGPALFTYMYAPDIIKDTDSWLTVLWKHLAGAVVSDAPVMRDIGAAALGGSYTTSTPPVQLFQETYKGLQGAVRLATGAKSNDAEIKDVATLLGLITGLPLQQPGKAAQFFWNNSTGHDIPHDYRDWLNGIMYGTTKGKKKSGHLYDPEVAAKRPLY